MRTMDFRPCACRHSSRLSTKNASALAVSCAGKRGRALSPVPRGSTANRRNPAARPSRTRNANPDPAPYPGIDTSERASASWRPPQIACMYSSPDAVFTRVSSTWSGSLQGTGKDAGRADHTSLGSAPRDPLECLRNAGSHLGPHKMPQPSRRQRPVPTCIASGAATPPTAPRGDLSGAIGSTSDTCMAQAAWTDARRAAHHAAP